MTRRPVTAIALSPELALPLELGTESTAILAIRRAGKSHLAKHVAEQLYAAGQQIVILDPKGDWWGLRSSADGKSPGIPIVILGGQHGDVPIAAGDGEAVARLVVERTLSVLIDLSDFSKGQVATFCAAFLEKLYRLKNEDRYRTPLTLIVDESDAIAPQKPRPGVQLVMLGAIDDCVRRGGQRGIGVILVSQRAAVLNKDVLTQCGILMLLRTSGSQDIEAVDVWIKKHGEKEKREQVMATIARLPRGDAWVWAPGWPDEQGIFTRTHVGANWTFDSGDTPKAGQPRILPKVVAAVDAAAFQAALAASIAQAKADDPETLKARIRELEKDATRARAKQIDAEARTVSRAVAPAPPTIEYVDRPVLNATYLDRLEASVAEIKRCAQRFEESRDALEDAMKGATEITEQIRATISEAADFRPRPAERARPPQRARRNMSVTIPAGATGTFADTSNTNPSGTGALRDMPRAFLTLLADRGRPMTRKALMVLAGYQSGGATSRAFTEMLREGWVTSPAPSTLELTATGRAALGDYESLPTGNALRTHLIMSDKMPLMERRMLERVCQERQEAIARTAVMHDLGYLSGGATSRAFTALIHKGYLEPAGTGRVRATALLFG